MASPRAAGGDKAHPIELLSTDDEKDAALGTTDGESEPILSLAWHLEHGMDATPKSARRAARQNKSNTPRGPGRTNLSESPTKAKQRAIDQVYPLPKDEALSVGSDSDRNATPPRAGPSSSRRPAASQPLPTGSRIRKDKIPASHRGLLGRVSGAPGSWENPEEMIFSDGHMVPRSSASESERDPRPQKSRGTKIISGPSLPASAEGRGFPQESLDSASTFAPAHVPSGSWDSSLEYRMDTRKPEFSAEWSKQLIPKRRPSSPSPPPESAEFRNKLPRLAFPEDSDGSVLRSATDIPQQSPAVKRLGPTWRTSSGPSSPLPSIPALPADLQKTAMEKEGLHDALPDLEPENQRSIATGPQDLSLPLEMKILALEEAHGQPAGPSSTEILDTTPRAARILRSPAREPSPLKSDDRLIDLPAASFDFDMDGSGMVKDEDVEQSVYGDAMEQQPENLPALQPIASPRSDPQDDPMTQDPVRESTTMEPLVTSLADQSAAPNDASSPLQVEQEVETVRVGVADVDLGGPARPPMSRVTRSPSIIEISSEIFGLQPTSSRGEAAVHSVRRSRRAVKDQHSEMMMEEEEKGQTPSKILSLGRYENMTRAAWRQLVEEDANYEAEGFIDSVKSSPSSSRSTLQKVDDQLYVSIQGQTEESTQQPPPDRRGVAKRYFNSAQIDEWNRRAPFLTHNPALHRTIFEAFIAEKELNGGISVCNDVDNEGAPPDLEFEYSNEMLYHPDVPDPEKSLGCDCEGPCDPYSKSCSCLRRQQAYFREFDVKGFAYDQYGIAKFPAATIWECSDTCGCPPSCINRVIQHGRKKETRIEIFKTRYKGWGVRAKGPIPAGQFIGIYAGELITEDESEKRGVLYTEIGRTYIFDADGWHLRHPPAGLATIDPRLAETAAATAQRANAAQEGYEDTEQFYSAYSVDAFHYGNYTRYFNHSCDPNMEIAQCYVHDFHPERPLLCIFTRRQIQRNEEMCISYKGIPDDDVVVNPSPRAKGRRGNNRHVTNAAAHAAHATSAIVREAKHQCYCGSANCDGSMFN